MSGGDFAPRLLRWFDVHGRHDLPWQHPRSAYRVWLSEVMLQQTQVATVIPYFGRFLARFPDLVDLARASIDEVLAHWSGLGYYSRGRNLHRAAQHCVEFHGSELPRTLDELVALPGIGRSTAAAILAQAHGDRVAILDGNVKRVLARHAGIEGSTVSPAIERRLWQEAETRLPDARLADYTQALMDLGATVCTPRRPTCTMCPVHADCIAFTTDRVAQLPTPKPRKTTPERSVVMLVLIDPDGRILFERRPPAGLWGGLLGLPECADTAAARAELVQFDHRDTDVVVGRNYRHVFTHFKLDITPWIVEVASHPAIGERECEWHAPSAFAELALPTAVRRVLDQSLRLLAG